MRKLKLATMLIALMCFTHIGLLQARESQVSQWSAKFSPILECPKFKIRYRTYGDPKKPRYQVGYYYQSKNKKDVFVIETKILESINNLGAVADKLYQYANTYCSTSHVRIGLEQDCGNNDHLVVVPTFSDNFIRLITQPLKTINKEQNNCKDIIPYMALQAKIGKLNQHDIIQPKSYKNILKVVADKEAGEMLDLLKECQIQYGKKIGSITFVQNLLMLTAQKSCVFPAPPGMISFNDALEISTKIANKYPKKTIFQIKKMQGAIEREAVTRFMKKTIKNSAQDILGSGINIDSFIDNLPSVKKINNEKNINILTDMASKVGGPNIPIELVESGMEQILYNNIGDKLGSDLGEWEKKNFIKRHLLSDAKSSFASCIAPVKRRIRYHDSAMTNEQMIAYRKGINNEYCKTNPSQCKEDKNTCSLGTQNYYTTRSDINDTGIIQACMLKSITGLMPKILNQLIQVQKGNVADYFHLKDSVSKRLASDAYKKLSACADKEIKIVAKNLGVKESKMRGSFTQNIEPLYHITTEDYAQAMSKCSVDIETGLASEFISLVISKTPAINDIYKTGKKVTLHGVETDAGSKSFADGIIQKVIPNCLNIQKNKAKNDPNLEVSAVSCRSIIEIEAIKTVVNNSLLETFRESNVQKNPEALLALKEFNNCAEEAIDNNKSALLNRKHSNPIMNSKDAEAYLNNNNDMFYCIKKSMKNAGNIISGLTVDDMAKVTKTGRERKSILSLKPKVQETVRECFKKKLDTIENLPKFIEFNDAGGMEKLKATCTKEATIYAMPKVVLTSLQSKIEQENLQNDLGSKVITSTFKTCTKKYSSIDSERNFVGCMKNSIISLSEHITRKTIQNISKAYSGKKNIIKLFKNVENYAASNAKSCFRKEFKEVKDIESFIEMNDSGKLEKVQEKCTEEITNYVLPEVVSVLIKDSFSQYGLAKEISTQLVTLKLLNCTREKKIGVIPCIKNAITETSGVITEKVLDDTYKENKDSIKDRSHFRKVKKESVAIVKACMKNGLGRIKTTNDFQDFNDSRGFEKLKAKCTNQATEYALPSILKNEALSKLKKVAATNITGSSDDILKLATKKIQADHNIQLSPTFLGDKFQETVKLAYRKFNKKNPKKATEDFIQYYTQSVQESTIGSAHSSIQDRVRKIDKNKNNFSEFFKAMGPKCLSSFFDLNKDFIEEVTNNQKDPDPTLDATQLIAELLHEGLLYSKSQGRYKTFVNKMKELCKDPKQYSNLGTFFKVKELGNIYTPLVSKMVRKTLDDQVIQQCIDDLAAYGIFLKASEEAKLCSPNITSRSDIKTIMKGHTSPEDKFIEVITSRKNSLIVTNRDTFKPHSKFMNELIAKVRSDKSMVSLLEKALKKDENAKLALTGKITDTIFDNGLKDNYVEKFTQAQLIGAIGLAYPEAKAAVEAEVKASGWIASTFFDTNAIEALDKRWNYTNISSLMSWRKLPVAQQKSTSKMLYEKIVKPRLKDTTKMSSAEKKKFNTDNKKNMDHLKKHVLDILEKEKVHSGTETTGVWPFDSVKSYSRSFTEQLAVEIEREAHPLK